MADSLRKAANEPFLVESDEGEIWTIAGTNSSIQFLLDESSAPIAILRSRGNPGDPVAPHFHKQAIDTWLVVQGKLKVWGGEEGRVLSAGDFAFVPPGVIHSYQVIEPHTEFLGLIHPAEWVNFMRAIGEVYTGKGPFPSNDTRHFPVPKFIQAIKDGHDVIPVRDHKLPEVQYEWSGSSVPSKMESYFLKAHTGPRYSLGNQTLAPLCTAATTDGKFSVGLLEGSSSMPVAQELSKLQFPKTCFMFTVIGGEWEITIEGQDAKTVKTGDSYYVPPNMAFGAQAKSGFSRAYVFGGEGPGLDVIFAAGTDITGKILGSDDSPVDDKIKAKLREVVQKEGIQIHGL